MKFSCESCGREQGLRQLRNLNGGCGKCGTTTWRLDITFVETASPPAAVLLASAAFGLIGGLLAAWASGMPAHSEKETMHLATSKIPAEDAAEIAGFGWGYKGAACRYMEMRQELDAAADRENQKTQGARHCLRCNYFFVPAADKPWTTAGYCSKGCCGSLEEDNDLPYLPVAPEIETASKLSGRAHSVVCRNGHAFEVAAMYVGTYRPCPICRQKTEIT